MALHIQITTALGSVWTVTGTDDTYGRAPPPHRKFWAFRVEGRGPEHLASIIGFYAGSLDEVAAELEGVRK